MKSASIWTASDPIRYFIVPDEADLESGSLLVRSPTRDERAVDSESLIPFEVTEEQARRWAKDQLGQTLDELKLGIDGRLADLRAQLEAKDAEPISPSSTITPNAGAALLDFFKALPGVVGQGISGDDTRVGDARRTMAELQQRLKDAGIDVDDRLQDFPERLADLRKPRRDPE